MYTLNEVPEVAIRGPLGDAGEGVVAVKSGSDTIRLFPGALKVLQDYHNGEYPGMRIAAASSADTPFAVKIARKALTMLEVVPGVTVSQGPQRAQTPHRPARRTTHSRPTPLPIHPTARSRAQGA